MEVLSLIPLKTPDNYCRKFITTHHLPVHYTGNILYACARQNQCHSTQKDSTSELCSTLLLVIPQPLLGITVLGF